MLLWDISTDSKHWRTCIYSLLVLDKQYIDAVQTHVLRSCCLSSRQQEISSYREHCCCCCWAQPLTTRNSYALSRRPTAVTAADDEWIECSPQLAHSRRLALPYSRAIDAAARVCSKASPISWQWNV